MYQLSVLIHILAAAVWVGGMVFIAAALVPTVRRMPQEAGSIVLRRVALRFRLVAWVSIVLLVLTGVLNLVAGPWSLGDLGSGEFWGGPFGSRLRDKLGLVALAVGLSLVHDFWIGPRAARLAAGDRPGDAAKLRKWASWIGRVNLLLVVGVLFLSVVLVRGWPW